MTRHEQSAHSRAADRFCRSDASPPPLYRDASDIAAGLSILFFIVVLLMVLPWI